MTCTPNLAVQEAGSSRKPMAQARQVTLFEREIRERLSGSAVEILFARAQILSEGKHAPSMPGASYFGSTMLTIDLADLSDEVRDRCDDALANRLAKLMVRDSRVTRRALDLALAEARRLAGGGISIRPAEVRVRANGSTLFIDVDVEGQL